MPIVKMPDGTNVSFPDEMPKEQIKGLIASKFPDAVPKQGAHLGHKIGAAIDGVAQGLTFGTSDEIAAGLQTGAGLWGDYDKALDSERSRMAENDKLAGGYRLAGEIGGGLTSGAGLVKNGLSLAARHGGKKLGTRILAGAGDGAIAGGLYGAGTGEGVENRAKNAAWGAGTGAVAGGVAEGALSGAQKMLAKRSGLNNEAVKAVSQADEFGVPLTRGQATGDVSQQALEDTMRGGGRGDRASQVMQQFDEGQQEALKTAGRRFAGDTGSVDDAGRSLMEGVKQNVDDAHKAGQAAYDRVSGMQASLPGDYAGSISQRVAQSLDDQAIDLAPELTPAAMKAVSVLDDFSKSMQGKPADMRVLEQTRKRLLNLKATAPSDRNAMRVIRKSYDDMLDEAVDKALFEGDDGVLDALKEARSLWKHYKSLSSPSNGAASAAMKRILSKEASPREVANWVIGSSTVRPPKATYDAIKHIKKVVGADSNEFSQIKGAAILKLMGEDGAEMGAQRIANNIEQFTSGPGGFLARELFTAEELGKLQSYGQLLKMTTGMKASKNVSQSGNRTLSMLRQAKDALFGLAGGFAIDPVTGMAAYLGSKGASSVMARRAARQATQQAIPKARNVSLPKTAAPAIPMLSEQLGSPIYR